MFSGKNNKFCKILLYILPVVMILGTDSLPVDAATFNHVHTNACYQTVVKTCTNHYLRPGREHQSFHCSNCGTTQPCTYLTWTDECLSGLREDYYCAWEITCDVCGNTIDSRPPGNPLTHQYQATELCCGKTENTVAATTSISASPTGWTAGNVTISSNVASNDSTFSVAGFSFNGGGFSGSSSATVSQNGTYSFTVKDNRGRTVTDSITVSNIDKQAPSLSLSKDSTGWTNGSVKISASGSDGQSGVNGYSFNGGGYSGTSSWSVTENGNYSVTVRDNVGNTSTQSISVSNIDRVNPTVSLSANTTDWTNSGVVITASGSDGQSGLASSAFSFNGTAYGSETSWEVGVNGSYSVYVKDNAGNSGSSSITISNIDKQAPSLSLSKNTEKWCEEGIDVIASADDNLSGIDGYSFNGGDFSGSSSWHVNANGTYSVTVRDKAGNTQTSSITVSNVGIDPEIIAQRKAAEEKARLEKEAQEKERKNREAKEKAEKEAKEKAAAEKAAQEKAAQEKASLEKALAEKAAAERAAAEKAVWEKSQADRAAAEKAAYEKAQAEKAALEKAQAEKEALEKALLEQEQLANSLSSESPSTTSANNNTKSSVSSESKVDSTSSKQDENSKDSQDSNQNDVSGNLISVNNSAGGDSNGGPGGSSNGKNVTARNTDLSNGIMFDSYSESFIADNASPTSQSLIQRLLSSPSGMFSVGIGLALSALLLLSTLNIVYYKDNGKIKPVSTAKIRRDKKRMFISVNPENLNEDRKYKVFLSIWTRLFRGERSIVFDIDGKKPATPINDEESFVYNG